MIILYIIWTTFLVFCLFMIYLVYRLNKASKHMREIIEAVGAFNLKQINLITHGTVSYKQRPYPDICNFYSQMERRFWVWPFSKILKFEDLKVYEKICNRGG